MELDRLWEIAQKVRGVYFSIVEETCLAQLDDQPVLVPRCTRPFCLPAIAHVFASPREQDIRPNPKVLIACKHDATAVEDMCEVEDIELWIFGWLFADTKADGGRWDGAVHAEACNTSIWDHVELDMRVDGVLGLPIIFEGI